MAAHALRFRAGAGAFRDIRAHGLDPARVQTLAGAAGGAKWLVLSALDRVLVRRLVRRSGPLELVGSSIGAWRFACYARADPLAAIARFEEAYIEQRYRPRPTPAEVTAQTRAILATILEDDGAAEILAHRVLRLHVVTARSRALAASERRHVLHATLAAAAAANALSRRLLGRFFVRTIFHDPRARPPFRDPHGLPTEYVALTRENAGPCILASGSIPLVLEPVRDIPGAPPGVYRDGGIVDYHFDARLADDGRLALFPHFHDHVAPGWFDKHWPGRRALAWSLDRTVLVHPSAGFVATLPGGRIPDRFDFARFDDATRIRRWREVVARCERLAEELDAALDGDLAARIEPLEP